MAKQPLSFPSATAQILSLYTDVHVQHQSCMAVPIPILPTFRICSMLRTPLHTAYSKKNKSHRPSVQSEHTQQKSPGSDPVRRLYSHYLITHHLPNPFSIYTRYPSALQGPLSLNTFLHTSHTRKDK